MRALLDLRVDARESFLCNDKITNVRKYAISFEVTVKCFDI